MFRVAENYDFLHRINRHQDVAPYVYENGQYRDLTKKLNSYNNVILEDGKYGYCLFANIKSGQWEAHFAFLKPGRGKYAVDFSKQSIKYMFSSTDCTSIIVAVPEKYLNSKIIVNRLDFDKTGIHSNELFGGSDFYELTFKEWNKCHQIS